jgi:hypothetical protein
MLLVAGFLVIREDVFLAAAVLPVPDACPNAATKELEANVKNNAIDVTRFIFPPAELTRSPHLSPIKSSPPRPKLNFRLNGLQNAEC